MTKKFTLLVASLCVFASAFAQDTRVADLMQDMDLLKREVGRLRLEVEQARNDNERLRAEIKRLQASTASSEVLNANSVSMRGEMDSKVQSIKKEIMQQVRKELESLASQTNANMGKLASAINSAQTSAPAQTQSFSDDFPKANGCEHIVASGDTLSAIAKKYGSRVAWIRNANKISDPNRGLRVGQKIWVPTE